MEILWKDTVSAEFLANHPKLYGNGAFPQNFHTRKLGKGNLIFCCTDPTDPNFQQIKIVIIVISHINIFDVYYLFFFEHVFLLGYKKIE